MESLRYTLSSADSRAAKMEADCEAAVERWKHHARKAGGGIQNNHSTDIEALLLLRASV